MLFIKLKCPDLLDQNIALANTNEQLPPKEMQATNEDQTIWTATLHSRNIENAKLLVIVLIDDTLYYGETETAFTQYKTSFSTKNMQ